MEFTNEIKFNIKPTANSDITIKYNGFLSGSSELFIVYGFNETWENTSETKMEKCDNGFTVTLKMPDFETFNFCFKNAENIWDNNYNCNYISLIEHCHNDELSTEKIDNLFYKLFEHEEDINASTTEVVSFDVDALIEQILEPIVFKENQNIVESNIIESTPIDLGLEVSNALSKIEVPAKNLNEVNTLDEILSGEVIEENNIELFEDTNEEKNSEKSLVSIPDPFIISSRQLSKFYLIKKHLKLFFYKAFVKIPKMVLGLDKE